MKNPLWIATLTLALTACGDQYRYPCQNPDNWTKPQCQKPLCDVNRTCPEHIFKGVDPAKMFPPGAVIPENLKSLSAAPAVPIPVPPRAAPPGACR